MPPHSTEKYNKNYVNSPKAFYDSKLCAFLRSCKNEYEAKMEMSQKKQTVEEKKHCSKRKADSKKIKTERQKKLLQGS